MRFSCTLLAAALALSSSKYDSEDPQVGLSSLECDSSDEVPAQAADAEALVEGADAAEEIEALHTLSTEEMRAALLDVVRNADEDTIRHLYTLSTEEEKDAEAGEEHMSKNEVGSSFVEEEEMEDESLNKRAPKGKGKKGKGKKVKMATCSLDAPHVAALRPHPAYVERAPVEEAATYEAVEFTHKVVLANAFSESKLGWADPEDARSISEVYMSQSELRNFNENSRSSYMGKYEIDEVSGRPLNPCGRTGMTGRGLLGKWGPNFAADPIVTRDNIQTGLIEVMLIERIDTKDWAIPGGMVDYGEKASVAAKREFMEEAGAFDEGSHELKIFKELAEQLFQRGELVYKGYVDDPRNTDNAWMETAAYRFHCSPELAAKLKTKAGDDAGKTTWATYDTTENNLRANGPTGTVLNIYASHLAMIQKAIT